MRTYYKVHSIGKDAYPSYIQDSDASVVILREQTDISDLLELQLKPYKNNGTNIQRSKQQYSVDNFDQEHDNELIILRKVFHNLDIELSPISFNIRGNKRYDVLNESNDEIIILRNNNNIVPFTIYSYDNTKKDLSFGNTTVNVHDYRKIQSNDILIRNKYGETNVVYIPPSIHIFKEYTCNSVLSTNKDSYLLRSSCRVEFKHKKTAESPRQRAFKANVFEKHISDVKINNSYGHVNVLQKTDIAISDSIGNVSLVIQKDTFFELKLTNVMKVDNLPQGVTYENGSIKGTLHNSGEYDIYVYYAVNKQIINIIVPFYRRLL